MEKRTVLAIALSMLILFAWSYIQQKYFMPPRVGNIDTTGQNSEVGKPVQQIPGSTFQPISEKVVTKQEKIVVKEITLETASEKVVINNNGATIRHWYLKDRAKEYDIVHDAFASLLTTLPEKNFSIDENLPQDKRITFSALIPEQLLVKKTYQFIDKSGYDKNCVLKLTISNLSREDKVLNTTLLSLGPGLGGLSEKKVKEDLTPYRAIIYRNKLVEKLKPGEYNSDYSWIALDNRYYLFALVPANQEQMKNLKTVIENSGSEKLPLVKLNTQLVIPGKNTANFEFNVYARTKKYNELKKVVLDSQIIRLEKSVDLGVFGSLSKIALDILNFFYNITRNYGVAIILLTILVQIIMYPLTWKSFQANIGMKKVQPLMKDLQVKYKNEPQRLQMEMLHLYKTHKVNPLSGCLPMLLQIPIFWALFTTLRDAYELRQSGFIFWIKDLSTRDQFYVLPILMGLIMFLQQKITTPIADQSQKIMIYLFPVIFTVMFLQFPSGLVLYWFVSSLVSFAIQMWLLKRAEQKK